MLAGSHVTRTTRSRTTRASSVRPRARSGQWCTVRTASAAANAASLNGSSRADACTTGALPARRWRIIVSDGSTATTGRSRGSYAPAPAPTFTVGRTSPSARVIAPAMRASGRRWSRYAVPIASYSCVTSPSLATARRGRRLSALQPHHRRAPAAAFRWRIGKVGHAGVARQRTADDLTLCAVAPTIDQAHLAKPTRGRGVQIVRDDRGDVARGERVEIEGVLDGDRDGRVVLA